MDRYSINHRILRFKDRLRDRFKTQKYLTRHSERVSNGLLIGVTRDFIFAYDK